MGDMKFFMLKKQENIIITFIDVVMTQERISFFEKTTFPDSGLMSLQYRAKCLSKKVKYARAITISV